MTFAHSVMSCSQALLRRNKERKQQEPVFQDLTKLPRSKDIYCPSSTAAPSKATAPKLCPQLLIGPSNGEKSVFRPNASDETLSNPYLSGAALVIDANCSRVFSERSQEKVTAEVIEFAQASLRGEISSQEAIMKADNALSQYPKSPILLTTRALLKFEAQDTRGCITDCREALAFEPYNFAARTFELVVLQIAGNIFDDSIMQDAKDAVAGRHVIESKRPLRLAIILSHTEKTGKAPTLTAIEEVATLFYKNPSDRCVAGLLALMHYGRWFWRSDVAHMPKAYEISEHMLRLWPRDRIATSIVAHLNGTTPSTLTPTVDFATRKVFRNTTFYPQFFLSVQAVLDYPIRILEPAITDDLIQYLRLKPS